MTSCLATVRPSLPESLHPKRLRAPSDDELAAALKCRKRVLGGSPRTPCELLAPAPDSDDDEFVTTKPVAVATAEVPWPRITGCEGLRNAIVFLDNSRQHATLLMMQNHWERAMTVLEKVEKATESVSSQRRKLVLAQANQPSALATAASPVPLTRKPTKRAVRFNDAVVVEAAPEVDRTAWEVQSPVREEMLVLRASRSIPRDNISELWH